MPESTARPGFGTAPPDVSLVVLSWNTRDLLAECLGSLRAARDELVLELIVVDNASADGSADLVRTEFPEVRLVCNAENRGYAPAVNQGLAVATGEFICLLGSDTRVLPGTLRALRDFLREHPEAGAVAPPLLNEDRSRQPACKRFPTLATAIFWDTMLGRLFPNAGALARYEMREWDHRGTREVDQPPGTCFFVRHAVADEVGPMDERLWLFFNDVDWAKRIRARGHAIWYVECPGVHHRESSSVRKFPPMAIEWHKNRIAYYAKHHGLTGAGLTKSLAVAAAIRQCFRARKDFPTVRAWLAHVKEIMGLAARVVRGR